jgi:transcription antitermination factor NusG
MTSLPWFCLRTFPKGESLAIFFITALGYVTVRPTILLPATRSRQPWRSGVRRTAMFPCYLFVAFDVGDPSWRRIATQPGVQRLLGSSPERPTPIPPWFVQTPTGQQTYTVEDLMLRPQEALDALAQLERITPGTVARPLQGPWEAQQGPCTATRFVGAEERVTLLLSLFGRPMPVEFRREEVVVVE